MAVEAKRGCGYRRIGGTYLEGPPGGVSCGRLPLSIIPCPLCDHRIPFTRGLQQVKPQAIATAPEVCNETGGVPGGDPARCLRCPLGDVMKADTVGLMWVGAGSYTTVSFTEEASRLGISKRIPHVPKWLEVGKTWVLLAHEQVFREPCEPCGGLGQLAATADTPGATIGTLTMPWQVECDACDGEGKLWRPGIFHAFIPTRTVRVVGDDTPAAELEKLRKRGLEPVIVPHDDPDHQPRKGGKGKEEED